MISSSIIVQGEGKGHFSQALAIISTAKRNELDIRHVFLGRSFFRKSPDYFVSELQAADVSFSWFYSPNFLRTPDKKGIKILGSILVNSLFGFIYLYEAFRIRQKVKRSESELVLNFYDPIGALAFRSYSGVKRIAISHHFYLAHPDFIHPHGLERAYFWMAMMNRFMIRSVDRAIALSFRKAGQSGKIEVFPPLIDPVVINAPEENEEGGRDLVYLLNNGFLYDILDYYRKHDHLSADIFTEVLPACEIPGNIQLHSASREVFLSKLQHASRVICTAGFDLVAESFYLGKPVFLIPSLNHYEQYCNSLDAAKTGMAYHLDAIGDLDTAYLKPLSNKKYREWVESLSIARLLA